MSDLNGEGEVAQLVHRLRVVLAVQLLLEGVSGGRYSPTLILLVSSLLVYHYSAPSQPAPASAIASTVFTGAGR